MPCITASELSPKLCILPRLQVKGDPNYGVVVTHGAGNGHALAQSLGWTWRWKLQLYDSGRAHSPSRIW
ncbi:hypothetical protein E2P81_ATG01533 [Venturia nashicola]|nr:hypothetical protein E2P81_ATG01533 [Venturia nashicola]